MVGSNNTQIGTETSLVSGKKVLIIEDDVLLGDIILKEMSKVSTNAKLLTSGEEALEVLKKEMPDIILLDIFLPGINGLEFLELIRKDARTKYVPVLVLSNTTQAKDRNQAKSLGAGFLTKALVTPSQIVEHVHEMLAKKITPY
jgi:CheY-like chemotaxis protein